MRAAKFNDEVVVGAVLEERRVEERGDEVRVWRKAAGADRRRIGETIDLLAVRDNDSMLKVFYMRFDVVEDNKADEDDVGDTKKPDLVR